MTKERAILFVDIDGTLVHGGSSVFLAHQLGHADTVLPADEAYAAGRSRNDEVARIDALGYAGHREDRVQALLERMPLIDGIVDLVSWSRSAGVVPILASLAWDCVGGHLASRFGFAGFCGPRLESNAWVYTGRVDSHFNEHDKAEFAWSTAHSLGLGLESCVAVGDGRSDLPLFEIVDLAIAFNASPDARRAADAAVDGPDIAAIIPLIEDWLR